MKKEYWLIVVPIGLLIMLALAAIVILVGGMAFLGVSQTVTTSGVNRVNKPVIVESGEPGGQESPLDDQTSADESDQIVVEVAPAALSFEAATYTDANAGFAFDYPAAWTPDEEVFGDRGHGVQFNDNDYTRLAAVVTLWDPKRDLDALIEQRQTGWSLSGMTIISEEAWTLSDGREAQAFVVEGPEAGIFSYFMFTTLGDDYLQFSGGGDLDLLAEIAHTVRPFAE